MSFRFASAFFGSALAIASFGAAGAQPRIQAPSQQPQSQAPAPQSGGGVIFGTNPELTLRMLQGTGFENLRLVTIENQRHVAGQLSGVSVVFVHAACENNACARIGMTALLGKQPVNVDWVNAWNREKGFTRLFLNQSGEVVMDMDVHFFGGATAEYIKQSGVIFATLLKQLFEFQPGK